MIHTKNLQFTYENGPSFSFPDLNCSSNEVLLVLGNSGTGKTTLLHLLSGLIQSSSGSITFGAIKLNSLSKRKMDSFRGDNIGIVFQTAHFIQSLNVIDNLIMPLYLTDKKIDRNHAQSLLDRLNIGNKSQGKPRKLSTGEQQRLTIARAIINKPQLILADEPTSALDDENANEVMNLLEEEAKNSGAALIIVTHDNRLKERYSNRIEL